MPQRDDHTGDDVRVPVITRDWESPPLTIGPKRIHYQFSVVLPQVHLVFVSILQGIALYVLLVDMPLPQGTTLRSMLGFAVSQYAYLPYVISGALVLVIWKQFAQASMLYIWPLSPLPLGLEMLISAIEIIAFREAANFGAWLVCLSLVGIVGGAIRLTNLYYRSPDDDFEMKNARRRDTTHEVWNGLLYITLGLAVFGAVIAVPVWPSYALYAQTIHWAALGTLGVIMVIIIVLEQIETMGLIQEEIGDGGLLVKRGGLRYDIEKQPSAADGSGSAEKPTV